MNNTAICYGTKANSCEGSRDFEIFVVCNSAEQSYAGLGSKEDKKRKEVERCSLTNMPIYMIIDTEYH